MTYKEFIDNIIQTRGAFGITEGYKERHHIVPKCLGGSNSKGNIIELYAREHFIAHRLLAKENPNNGKLQHAWWLMANCKDKNQERYTLTAEEYEEVKKTYSVYKSSVSVGVNNAFYGKKHTEETRNKISASLRGKPSPNKGKKLSEETKRQMSERSKGRHFSLNCEFKKGHIPWNKNKKWMKIIAKL